MRHVAHQLKPKPYRGPKCMGVDAATIDEFGRITLIMARILVSGCFFLAIVAHVCPECHASP
jgi:hypothetical protein